MSSTRSSESAFRSSTKDASGLTLVDPELLHDDLLEPLVGFAFGQTGYLLRVYAARPSALGSPAQVSGARNRSSIRPGPD